MALFDLPLDVLRDYRPPLVEPADFDDFWAGTLGQTRSHPLDPVFTPYEAGLSTVDTYDVTFAGWAGESIKAWLLLPGGAEDPLPCVVEYAGYGGGRAVAHDRLLYSAAGYAHLVMDTRGQPGGDTGDTHATSSGPHNAGFMTDGVLDPATYYYRRLMSDAVRAVEAARAHPLVDESRIAVAGGSQGGGLTIAVAGLVGDLVAALPDVPFLCHFRRAVDVTDEAPYAEIAAYCRQQPLRTARVFDTLAYFDGVHFAARATAPALFSVGLMDQVCPPSTVFAAYNRWHGEKDIRVWDFGEHAGGAGHQAAERLAFLRAALDRRSQRSDRSVR